MTAQTKTVEVHGYSGLTTAFAVTFGGTGVAISATPVAHPTVIDLYTVTIAWDDSDAANEPIGQWVVTLGGPTTALGGRAVLMKAGKDEYKLLDNSEAEEIAQAVIDAATAIVDAGGSPVVIPPATAAGACNCALQVVDVHTVPVEGAVLSSIVKVNPAWTSDDEHLILPVQTRPTSNSSGMLVVQLAQSTAYLLTVKTLDGREVTIPYLVPAATSDVVRKVTV